MATEAGNIWYVRASAFLFSILSSYTFLDRETENTWMVTVALRTRKMMTGEMIRTRRRTAMPNACCWLAALSSVFTISLQGGKNNYDI